MQAEKVQSDAGKYAADAVREHARDPITAMLRELNGEILAAVYCHARYGVCTDALKEHAGKLRLLLSEGTLNPACIPDVEAEVFRRAAEGRKGKQRTQPETKRVSSRTCITEQPKTTVAAEHIVGPAGSLIADAKRTGRRPGTVDAHQMRMRGHDAEQLKQLLPAIQEPHRSILTAYLRGVPFRTIQKDFHMSPSELHKAIAVGRRQCDAVLNQGAGI